MTPPWATVIAALVSGLLVAVATYLVNRRKTNAETDKMRAETDKLRAETAKLRSELRHLSDIIAVETDKIRLTTQQAAFAKLQEARIREYPHLYALLSDLQKALDQPATVTLSLHELLRKINEWDSQYAVFLGAETSNKCHAFRMTLVEIVRDMSADEPSAITERLVDTAETLELALRTDLGIYGIGVDGPDLAPREVDGY